MKKLTILFAILMMVASCKDKNPFLSEWNTPYGIPPFDQIKTEDYIPAIKEGIEQQKKELDAIINNPEAPNFANTIAAFDLSGELLAKVSGVLFNLAETDADSTLNKVEDEANKLLTAHSDDVYMNRKFFERVKAVYEADQSHLDREQQMVLKKLYQAFTRNGVDLSEEDQQKMKEINQALSDAQHKFGDNLLAQSNAFKAEFGIPVSAYPDEMASCTDRDRRKAMFEAYSNRANHGDEFDNKAICLQILKLKAQKAKLLGFDTFAAYQLDNKMAHDPQTVDAFLDEIQVAANAKSKEEVADMQKVMDRDIQAGLLPKGSKIEPWDWFYYAEKVRALKYDLDESVTKPYFTADSVAKGVFHAAEKVYGIHIEPAPEVEVYNPVTKAFKLTDADGSLLGIFYQDWFSRDTKRGGAWMNNFRDQYVKDGVDVRPVIVNVCNFPPATEDTPSMLSIDNVQTAFHEFGHALHGFLTKCRYPDVSGTAVTRDFVEMFSQFNENFAFEPDILAVYAKDYRTGEPIPTDLVEKIGKSLKFNQGFTTGELCAASILDMKWHELTADELAKFTDAQSIRDFETKVCAEMGLIDEIIPRYRTTYFNHIFNSGYSAGYYSYLWSEVLDVDAWEKFEADGVFNPATAKAFRETFLERGGTEEPMTLYRSFRGADPDPAALLRARGLE